MKIETLFLVSLTPASRGNYSGYEALLVSRTKKTARNFIFEEQLEQFAAYLGKAAEYLVTEERTKQNKTLVNYTPVPDASSALADFLGE